MKKNIKNFVYGSIVALNAFNCFDKPTLQNNFKHLDHTKSKKDAETKNGTQIAENKTQIAENKTQTAENGTQTAENKTQTAENKTQTAENGGITPEELVKSIIEATKLTEEVEKVEKKQKITLAVITKIFKGIGIPQEKIPTYLAQISNQRKQSNIPLLKTKKLLEIKTVPIVVPEHSTLTLDKSIGVLLKEKNVVTIPKQCKIVEKLSKTQSKMPLLAIKAAKEAEATGAEDKENEALTEAAKAKAAKANSQQQQPTENKNKKKKKKKN